MGPQGLRRRAWSWGEQTSDFRTVVPPSPPPFRSGRSSISRDGGGWDWTTANPKVQIRVATCGSARATPVERAMLREIVTTRFYSEPLPRDPGPSMTPERFQAVTSRTITSDRGGGETCLDRYLEIVPRLARSRSRRGSRSTMWSGCALAWRAGTIVNNLVALGIGEIQGRQVLRRRRRRFLNFAASRQPCRVKSLIHFV